MKPGEELMLLLELNDFDILKFKLRKQLEYEDSGNSDIYKHKKYSDLIISHYSFKENKDYFHRNPLSYETTWPRSVKSIDQFIFTHPDLDSEYSYKDFLTMKYFNKVNRESIIYDVLDNWIKEYRNSSITKMETLKEMIKLLPKKSEKYRKPSILILLLTIFLSLLTIMLYKNPVIIYPPFFTFIADYVNDINQLLYDIPEYSFFGLVSIIFLVVYVLLNNSLSRFIRSIRRRKNKHAERKFAIWNSKMEKLRLKQSEVLEEYVEIVVKESSKSFLELKSLLGPEILMNKSKAYVLMIEDKCDRMTKHYSKLIFALRLLFVLSILLVTTFYVSGFALLRGSMIF